MQNSVSYGQCVLEEEDVLKTSLVSRNITVSGRRTSVRLEPEMWTALREIARRENCTIHDICTLISFRKKENSSLTAAIRVFLMLYFRAATTEDGHNRAGHGNFEHMQKRARVPSRLASLLSEKNRSFNISTKGNSLDLDIRKEAFGSSA
ncbi:MAG: ribbon-helix-helix domain-containing protein [Alphaproteobacteria bacterium]|nr:ribbon-helix-helix domain-containing protein [Alphaproteobacteria bacterium]